MQYTDVYVCIYERWKQCIYESEHLTLLCSIHSDVFCSILVYHFKLKENVRATHWIDIMTNEWIATYSLKITDLNGLPGDWIFRQYLGFPFLRYFLLFWMMSSVWGWLLGLQSGGLTTPHRTPLDLCTWLSVHTGCVSGKE